MKTKICGITTQEQIDWINDLAPAYIGFVFVKQSRRFVTMEQALAMRVRVKDWQTETVGVFMNHSISEIVEALPTFDMIQLHGNEDDDYIRNLREYTDSPIIKAFDLDHLTATTADFVLIDSPRAGSGQSFDWHRLQQVLAHSNDRSTDPLTCENIPNQPYFLAGGLTPDNIQVALEVLGNKPP